MYSARSHPVCSGCEPRTLDTDEKVIEEVSRQAAVLVHPPNGIRDRRTDRRFPYPRLIPFTPMNDRGQYSTGPTRCVVGKHLAPLGLDFFHHEPLPERYAVVSLSCGANRWIHLMLRITWCRFLRPGWYDSGGHFTRIVEWPEPTAPPYHLTGEKLSYALNETLISRCTP